MNLRNNALAVFKTATAALILVPTLVIVTGCERTPESVPLPTGMRTLSGVLVPVPLSLERRGTHRFTADTDTVYLAESTKVPLRRYENKSVVLRGTLEQNLDPSAPAVLVVDEILSVVSEPLATVDIPSLGIKLSAPESWRPSISESATTFTVISVEEPLVTISRNPLPDPLPSGMPVIIDRRRAVRQVNAATGVETVYFADKSDSMLVFVFAPQESPDAVRLRGEWEDMLSSVTLQTSAGQPVLTGSGTVGEGTPCGGSAGILCPAGTYCDIQNVQENIGLCRRIGG